MDAARWDNVARGINSPYDAPRPAATDYYDFVAKLSISSLCLAKNQASRGSCALIFDPRHVVRIDQLSSAEWASFSSDLLVAEAAIVRALRPDHVNVGLLGNTIPHLHWVSSLAIATIRAGAARFG